MTVPLQKSFSAFTIKHNGLANRITTKVQLAVAFDPKTAAQPFPPHIERIALWDTGATRSVITEATAQALQLAPIGQTTVNHAGGASISPTYMVNFVLPNAVGVAGVLVSQCPDGAGCFDAIIGMDIINRGDLALTNVGNQTWMSFRYPSIAAIDYVVEANQIKFAGVSRNDPCPCGKRGPDGRPVKFKHCHGGNSAR